jgi:hypothetical protein
MEQQIIARIPHKGMDGYTWGAVIENELIRIWREAISTAELVALEATEDLSLLPPGIVAKLDDIILDQAEDLGWRMELSRLVQWRQSEWPPRMHEEYGAACARAREVELGDRRPRIKDPAIRDGWNRTMKELRAVRQRMRDGLVVLRRTPNERELKAQFQDIIRSSDEFVQLRGQMDHWCEFIERNPDTFRVSIERSQLMELLVSFQSWTSGFTEETLKKKIYALPGTVRD